MKLRILSEVNYFYSDLLETLAEGWGVVIVGPGGVEVEGIVSAQLGLSWCPERYPAPKVT